MRPTTPRSNQSSSYNSRLSPITSSATSSFYHQQQQQQQQQQILYAPINNPMVTLQPYGTAIHPSCVYPNAQAYIAPSSTSLHLQGKNNRWYSKNKSCRGQQFYQPQQQQLQCSPKPVILFEQPSSSISPISPSSTSFLVTSSTFTHGPLLNEHYNSSGMTVLPQSYFKPPDMQTFCMIQDRQNTQQQHPMHASYYNISATNTCSLQTVNTNTSFPLSNLNSYTNLANFTNNQYQTSVQSSPIFTNPSVDLVFGAPTRDKPLSLKCSPIKHNTSKISSISESRVVPISCNEKSNDWPPQTRMSLDNSYEVQAEESNKNTDIANCSLQKFISDVIKTDEEQYSDESSNSFDFSIEAEKMVSALCNTTSSNDLSKEELKIDKTESTPLFNGAGDNMSNNKGWFIDLSPKESRTSIGIQTDGPCTDRSQYPELIRNTAYWGCIEAEIVINSESSQADSKRNWLTCLSSATRTAITKSSTCIPVFAGDRVFINDLINALLRVSNGWLSLDNYLNKQHLPNVLDRLDPEFIACFHTWEENTYELLKQIVQAFRKLEENNEVVNIEQKHKEAYKSSSFPGDVSLYTDCDLFNPLSQNSLSQQQNTNGKIASQQNLNAMPMSLSTNNLRNFEYDADQQKQQSASYKENKLRSKWTITGNLSSLMNGTRSVPNVSVCHTEIGNIMSNKLRVRDTSSSLKLETTQKSLNAEFSQLRNKIMESDTSIIKQLKSKDKKQECRTESKFSRSFDNTESARLQNPVINTPISYNGLYAQNYLSFTFPLSTNSESLYHTPNSELLMYGSHSYPSSKTYSVTDSNLKSNKNHGYSCAINAKMNSPFESKTLSDHVELPTIPKNKMTLLSQIEPRIIEKESKEMAANLSAWFASMRNVQLPATVPTFQELRINQNSTPRLFTQQQIPKYSTSTIKQSQTDVNRQFQALQNLQNIQSTPWVAGNFIGNHTQIQQVPDEYDSSEDVRVYMKPGSYNVPKKRHQRRPNRRSENNTNSRNAHTNNHHNTAGNKGKNILIPASSTPLSHINISTLSNINNATLIKTSFPPASQLPAPVFKLENSPRILRRIESLSSDNHQDVTWKAACASAEILLEALNVKDCTDISRKDDCNDNIGKNDINEDCAEPLLTILQQSLPKSMKPDDADCASSYEASEDDSESTCKLSPTLSMKANVKTDSWLIRTLNNASIVSKQKWHKNDVDRRSLESSNSSETIDVKPNRLVSTPNTEIQISATVIDREYPTIFSPEHIFDSLSKNAETSTKELKGKSESAGKATYSETVRRSMKLDTPHLEKKESTICNTAVPGPDRKCQKKDLEQCYQLLYKTRRSVCKKSTDTNEVQEKSCTGISDVKTSVVSKSLITTKTHSRKKEQVDGKCANKSGDRGWSVWYSSKRKQTLNPLVLSKLEIIYHTILQMDEAKILEHSFSYDNKDNQCLPAKMIDNYSKIIDYKLKNRIYHKVEHAVKDFRRIIYNARLRHQHDNELIKKIEILSERLEDLLKEHFGNWNFDHITTDSPRESSSIQQRSKTTGQKLITERCDNVKKSAFSIAENCEKSLLH